MGSNSIHLLLVTVRLITIRKVQTWSANVA